jgi:cell division control protein CDC15
MNYLKIGKVVNRGAFGIVYKGKYFNDEVAVKKVPLFNPEHQRLTRKSYIQRELVNWKSASDGENIVKFHGYVEDRDFGYFICEYCKYGSCYQPMNKMPPIDNIKLLHSILKGIVHCHDKNIAHCDIKSANIMMNEDNIWKIGDFGGSNFCLQEREGLSKCRGTPLYMPVEMFNKEMGGYGKNVDVWALGILAFGLYTSTHPFCEAKIQAEYNSIFNEIFYNDIQWVHMDKVGDNFVSPKEFDLVIDFIKLCLQKDKNQRPTSTELLSHALFTL